MTEAEQTRAIRQLQDECHAMGIDIDAKTASTLVGHLDLVIEKNKVMNLTRITGIDEAVTLHIVDSLALVPFVPKTAENLIDIGTGAGYPGIPLCVATGIKGTLLDSTRKKCDAVQSFVDALYIEACEVVCGRAEEIVRERRESYDVVTARAVSSGATIVEYASPLLSLGGRLVLAKGNISDDEAAQADRAAEICSMSNVSRETFELPHGAGTRTVIVYEKTGQPKVKLPRNAGMAQHHPLG